MFLKIFPSCLKNILPSGVWLKKIMHFYNNINFVVKCIRSLRSGERRHLRRAHVFSIIHQTIRDKYGRHIGKLKINIRSKTYEAPCENRNSASQWPRIYFSDVMVTRFFPQIVEIIIKNKYYLFPIKLRWHRCNADNSFFGANLRFPLGLRISEAHVRGLVFWVWVCVTIVKDVYMCRFFRYSSPWTLYTTPPPWYYVNARNDGLYKSL